MNYLVSTDIQPVGQSNLFLVQEYPADSGIRYCYLSPEEITEFPIDDDNPDPIDVYAIGVWENGGLMAIALHPDFEIIRPFGNADGSATDKLDLHHFQGHGQRQVQETPVAETMAEYPADNQPIILRLDRWYDETAGFEGWGWKATITFADPNRAPDARAIGVYDDLWAYLYTTGAFVLTETGQDEEGQPIMEWQTHSAPGYATVEKEPLYFALLFGSAQEGRMILADGAESVSANFWEGDQAIPGGSAWVDTGITVDGMAGTVTLVSDVTPFYAGAQVRIDGVEMVVDSIWTTQGLNLTPYIASPTGAAIEIWQ